MPLNDSTIIFAISDLSTGELDYLSNDGNHTFNSYNFLSSSPTPNCYAQLNSFASNPQDSIIKNTLTLFLNGFNLINGLSNQMAFINDYENYIINNSSFTTTQKQILLQSLSTAKYSAAFWHDAYNLN